jgi:hypothetical protein
VVGGTPPAAASDAINQSTSGPLRWLQRQWWGLDMAWSRWWLGFDQARQEQLLRQLLGERRWALGWLILAGVGASLTAGLLLLHRGPRSGDPLERDLRGLLRLLRELGLQAAPGETLQQLAARAASRYPSLAQPLSELAACHSERRFAPAGGGVAALQARRRWRDGVRMLKRCRRDAIRQESSSRP